MNLYFKHLKSNYYSFERFTALDFWSKKKIYLNGRLLCI